MATVDVPLERVRFGRTARKDAWWAMPLTTFVVFTSFVVYVTWALFQGENYHFGNYLSPLYSPELFGDSPHAMFGPWKWPWIPFIKYSQLKIASGLADRRQRGKKKQPPVGQTRELDPSSGKRPGVEGDRDAGTQLQIADREGTSAGSRRWTSTTGF
jgi:hypothetical protein